MSRQLVVIDARVANVQSLIEQLGVSYSYLLLNADADGLAQLADYVEANSGLDSIHLISHGAPGQFAVGSVTLSEQSVESYSAVLGRIGASLGNLPVRSGLSEVEFSPMEEVLHEEVPFQ
jgi:hypothetical protein